jgi:DMSO/TMAO reductase YedYZ molybdopterin-dependent catalytic subunit
MRPSPSRRRFVQLALFGTAAACAPGGKKTPVDADTLPEEIDPITPNEEFYEVTYSGAETVDGATWTLTFDGACEGGLSVTLADLEALPSREKEHTLACISSSERYHAIGNAVWTGLPLPEVLAAFGVVPSDAAIELQFTSADGYRTALPITDLDDREIWLVWKMNGEALPVAHGYPARLLVPNRYGMKNPKWITDITFGLVALLGTWETVGWSNDCTWRPCAYLHSPPDNSSLEEGALTLTGSSYCGSVAIERVEVSADGGDTWEEVEWTYQGPVDTWSLWRLRWTPPGPGTYTLLARAVAADGRASDPDYVFDRAGFQGYGELVIEIT